MNKGTASSTSSGEGKAAAQKAAAKRGSTRKTAAKKPARRKAMTSSNKGKSKVEAGTMLMVTVNGGHNDVDMAPAIVTRGLNVVGETRVNVVAFVDGDGPRNLRNVPVLAKAPKASDKDAPTVYALKS